MLTKEGKKLADKVLSAYMSVKDGGLYEWVGRAALRDRMRFPEWSTDYIGSVHSIVLAVICRMVEDRFITLKEVEDSENEAKNR